MNETLQAFLEQLAQQGADNDARHTERSKRMLNITADTGRFLWILVRALGAKRILEVGTSNAFSTIWLADAACGTGGCVTTLERNPKKIALARANLATAALAEWVEIIEGPAAASLALLPGPFDVVFLDADRSSYLDYLDLVLSKLRPGGLLIADNATSHPNEMRDFLHRVKSDPKLFAVTVPIGKGEEIVLKLA